MSKSRATYWYIKRLVASGEAPAGAPVDISQLCEDVVSSHVPIREALGALAAEGLVDSIPGRGFFWKSHEFAEVLATYDLMQFLVGDAAAHIMRVDGYHARGDAKRFPEADPNYEAGNVSEVAASFMEAITAGYRLPHARILDSLVFRVAFYLNLGAERQGYSLHTAVQTYFDAINRGDARLLERLTRSFWERQRKMLPEIMIHVANFDTHAA